MCAVLCVYLCVFSIISNKTRNKVRDNDESLKKKTNWKEDLFRSVFEKGLFNICSLYRKVSNVTPNISPLIIP